MELGDLYTSKLGRKSARLRSKDTQEAITLCTTPMIAPFGLSTFEKNASRQSLSLRCSDAVTLAFFEELDRWALKYLEEHSERVLGKKLSAEQIAVWYKPCLKTTPGYEPLLKVKIGPDTCYWDAQKQRLQSVDDTTWRTLPARYKLSVPQMWIMPGSCGFLVCADHVCFSEQANDTVQTCPL